ncbi:PucR family transcriptional regulator [Kitasatospora sp. NPDC094015]|uniref:PucR family transcriptional regulator n=1 Tax=Kitasatospora sp. NPDC094015 TaxID=3155205 RepID=UPI00331BB095
MIVGDLLELDSLHIGVTWATPELLGRQVTGVTSTDLQDPARYLQPGELVLTGLVWWRPGDADAAVRFATSLRSAEVAALLAGEGTHGTVPEALVAACRTHGIPLLSVPSGTSFRAVTDRIYLRLWGDLQARSQGVAAVPEAVRREVVGLMHSNAPLTELLAHAVARLGLPDCSVLTGGGRVLAASAEGGGTRGAVPVGPPGDSPFDGWVLQPHTEPTPAAATVLHGLAELLAPLATRARATAAAQRQTAARILDLLDQGGPGLADTLLACGLPERQPLTPVTVRIEGGSTVWAAAALADALHRLDVPFAAAPCTGGGTAAAGGAGGAIGAPAAVGLVAAPAAQVTAALRAAWPGMQSRLTARRLLRAGVGPSVRPEAGALRGALVQAGYALDSRVGGAVGSSAELGSLAALLRGIPAEVTAAFHTRLLAPLAEHDRQNGVSLLGTLGTFLDHDGSWSRTAEALHIHVNTVHYRIRRIEELTGRSLARLEDRLDLRAALLCAPPQPAATR